MQNKITKIAHLADTHLRNSLTRQEEYQTVLQRTIDSIKKQNPQRICIVGDIFHNFIEISNEAKDMAGWFLTELSKCCKVIITRGNHDIQKSNKNRMDSIQVIINLLKNPNIVYYNKSGFYEDENVMWVVWHHGDDFSPWKKFKHERKDGFTYIDLFHNPIRGTVTETGRKNDSPFYNTLDDFKGDYLFAGDQHLKQLFYK